MSDQETLGSLHRRGSIHLAVRFSMVVAILLLTASAEGVTVSPPSCAAIQNAINSLPPGGGEVVLQPGTFTCTSAIVINRNNVRLRGEGFPTLRLAVGANSPVLVIGETTTPPTRAHSNIDVSNLQIDGNRLNQTMECWTGPCDTGGFTFIRNSGIVLRRVKNVSVRDVTVKSARSAGLVSEHRSRLVTVEKLRSSDNQFDGLAAYETEESVFTGLYVHENLFAGLSFDLGFNRNVVSDSVLRGNEKVGVFLRHSADNVFHGLQILRSGEHGIFLAENPDTGGPAVGNTFTGVIVGDSGVAPDPAPPGAGMRVNDSSCVNNLVVGSQFARNEAGCISEVIPGLVAVFGTICR